MKHIQNLVALILISLIFWGCSSDKPEIFVTPESSPENLPKTISSVPTPSNDDVGVITGVFLVGLNSPAPVVNVRLGLGDAAALVTGSDGETIAKLILTTRTDVNGRFVFKDLLPKNYVLAAVQDGQNIVLHNPIDGSILQVMPNPSEILDLGTLTFQKFPN